MDLVIFVFATAISFILVLFTSYERVIGIAGMLLQFVTIGIAGFDGTIIMARGWDSSGNALNQAVVVYPEFIVLGFSLIAIYFIIFMKINSEYRSGLIENE